MGLLIPLHASSCQEDASSGPLRLRDGNVAPTEPTGGAISGQHPRSQGEELKREDKKTVNPSNLNFACPRIKNYFFGSSKMSKGEERHVRAPSHVADDNV